MATVSFKLIHGPDFDKMNKVFLATARRTLHDEVKRVGQKRFRPLVKPWTAKNRTSFRVKRFKPRKGARSIITATDKEDGKPLFKFVHQTGVRPHIIRATKPHGLLVFQKAQRTIFTRKPVNHPGYKSSGEYDKILREEPDKIRRELEFNLSRNLNIVRR